MQDLKMISGLDIKLNNFKLLYDNEIYKVEAKPREYTEAIDVYLDKDNHKQMLYWMHRYFEAEADKKIFNKYDLEHDITVMKNGFIGTEFIKTIGHYHPAVKGQKTTYPEVYEVISGQIEYLLQTKPSKLGEVDVFLVQAEAGDKIVVPPGYGHVSINVGKEVAVSSNLQKKDLPTDADYDFYKKHQGGAFYRTEKGLDANTKYKINNLRVVKPLEKPEFGLTKEQPLYLAFLEHPDKFDFLINPQKYSFDDFFEDIKL